MRVLKTGVIGCHWLLLPMATMGQSSLPPEIQRPSAVPAAMKIKLVQAQDEALVHSPLIQSAQAEILGAKANFSGQRVPINPTFFIGGLNNTVSTLDLKNPSDYDAILTIETNGAIQWRTSEARNQLLATESDAETTRLSVTQGVTDAYINLQVANLLLANEEEAYASSQKLSDLTEKQFSLGAAPETNAIRTHIALTQEEGNLLAAISAVRVARANLNIQMGRDAYAPVDTSEPLAYAPTNENLSQLTVEAEKNRPELQSAEYNLKALRATVGLQRTQYFPQLFVGTDMRQVKTGGFQFGLSLPLFDFGSIRGSVNKAKQDAKAQESQIKLVIQSIGLDVVTGFDNLERARRTVEAYHDGILPRSASLLSKIQQGYQLGAGTILDLLDAQNTYRSTQNGYASALGDYNHAKAQLERAIGGPLISISNGVNSPLARKSS